MVVVIRTEMFALEVVMAVLRDATNRVYSCDDEYGWTGCDDSSCLLCDSDGDSSWDSVLKEKHHPPFISSNVLASVAINISVLLVSCVNTH